MARIPLLLTLCWMIAPVFGAEITGPRPGQELARFVVPVLVVSCDPVLKGQGGQRLSQFMKWNDARAMTRQLVSHLREASGGQVEYQVVDFLELDHWPVKRDGFRYDESSFLEMWKDKARAHQPDAVSYGGLFRETGIEDRVRAGEIRDVWVWGAPYFGTDEYAMKIPGDRLFYPTDNPWFYRPYDIPEFGRTVWVMGFNYEVGVDNALHSFGHRCEGILSLTVGRGVWEGSAGETNAWSRFTRQAELFPADAQVGNVHGGPNARGGYDYGQTNAVLSAAGDWFTYPRLSGRREFVSAATWGAPHHLNFMRWWLDHLPRNPGSTGGFYNNWWRYVVDYDAAVKTMPPPGEGPRRAVKAMY